MIFGRCSLVIVSFRVILCSDGLNRFRYEFVECDFLSFATEVLHLALFPEVVILGRVKHLPIEADHAKILKVGNREIWLF